MQPIIAFPAAERAPSAVSRPYLHNKLPRRDGERGGGMEGTGEIAGGQVERGVMGVRGHFFERLQGLV